MSWLLSGAGEPLLRQAEQVLAFDAAAIERLRREHPREAVATAVALVRARRKAAGKLRDAERLALDPQGVEQATDWLVAQHKATRFATLGAPLAVDLCCGVGGDAMALAGAAGRLLAIDRDPARAWMTARNAGCAAAVGDVTELRLDGLPFHLDPDRRDGGRRIWRYEDYRPGPAFIRSLLQRKSPAGAVKLGPGVELDVLPAGEIELVSLRGRLVQAVLWTGALAGTTRLRATRLPEGLTLSGPPVEEPLAEPGRYLLALDPAVERAGLAGVLCEQEGLASIHPALGLLTTDDPAACRCAWLVPFELQATLPWRPKKVRAWLANHGAGPVEVKTRGGAVDPERARRELRGPGDEPFTVFVLRHGRRVVCYVTRRV